MQNKSEIVGTADVTLIKENEDGSAVYSFNFPPEAMEALTRLGITTAIQAGIGEAKKMHPDYEVSSTPVMDDNIKRLAEQAGFTFWGDEYWKPEGAIVDWAAADDSDLVRFYHLIVRECLSNMEDGDLDFAIWKTKKECDKHMEMMDDTAKDADRAYELLRRAEVEMRYAGWNKYESDNTARNGVYEQIVVFLKRARKG